MKLKRNISVYATAFLGFVVLDYLWFSFVSGDFFFQKMRPIANTNADGEIFSIGYWSAAVVYALLSLGILYLVTPHQQKNTNEAALAGSLYGLVVYGVYDFTNHATLEHWPLDLMAVDVVWGAFSSCLVSILLYRLYGAIRS